MKMKKWTKATLGALAALAVCAAPMSTYADSDGAVQVTFEGPSQDRTLPNYYVLEQDTATLTPMQIVLNGKMLANTYAVTDLQTTGSDQGIPNVVPPAFQGILVPINVVSEAMNGQFDIQSYMPHEDNLVGFGVSSNYLWTFNTLLYRKPLPMIEGDGGFPGIDNHIFSAEIAINLNWNDTMPMLPIQDPATGQTDDFVPVSHFIRLFDAMGFQTTYNTTTNQLVLTGPTPRPTYTKVTPQLYKEAVAQAQQAQAHHTTGMFGMLANNAQWYPDPKNVFFNRHFDVQHLKPGQVLQKWPWVVFLKGNAWGGDDEVAELVSRGNNGQGLNGYNMIVELVDKNTGNVVMIDPGGWFATLSDLQGAVPPALKVPNIGDSLTTKYQSWAYGYGLDVVPNLSWHQGINPVNP
ncbi:hypothetical protein [Alicyclobacillus sendaiensis]|uniref:hypothetical protein n=1 Tax=Alicyclobacillus sendaiensis TaxID=192387 RepID=UPI0026F41050|nr:hypothetical protein [Alicyclobacillus sendaiensis]